jgi:ssDNA-binding Zn-finger/Zn-ribbon topoisomerase 1
MDMRTGEASKSNISWETDETPVRVDCPKCQFAIWAAVRDNVPTEIICGRINSQKVKCGGSQIVTRKPNSEK